MAIERTEKILIVDDSSFMRRLVVEAVRSLGFTNILEAEDGVEAISLYTKEKPDVMLMDLIMPNVTGIEVLRKLVPLGASIIVISAIGQKNIIEDAFVAGAKGYFIKPFFETSSIQSMIESALRGEVVKHDHDVAVQFEEHRAVAQHGARKSASALATILRHEVTAVENKMLVSSALKAFSELVLPDKNNVVGITGLLVNVPGFVYIDMEQRAAYRLVDLLNGREVGTTTSLTGEIEGSTIKEILNILSNSYTSVFTPCASCILATSLPYVIGSKAFRAQAERYLKMEGEDTTKEIAVFTAKLAIPKFDIYIQIGFMIYYEDIIDK